MECVWDGKGRVCNRKLSRGLGCKFIIIGEEGG